jgi:nickel/cobalt transporter (NicO) family protein
MPVTIRRSLQLGILIVALIAMIGMAAPVAAQATDNPFGPAPETSSGGEAESAAPGLIDQFIARIALWQRDFAKAISLKMREIKEGRNPWALILGLLIAFGYGAAHAAGPGHGKGIVISYFLSRDAPYRRGVIMAAQIALVHVIAAILVVGAIELTVLTLAGKPAEQIIYFRILSYGAIVIIGTGMLYGALRRAFGHEAACCSHGASDTVGHEHSHHHDHVHQGADRGIARWLSFAAGVIPCSGAVLVMVYALANGILLQGIVMVLGIAAGMASALALLGLAAIRGRRWAAARAAAGASGGRPILATLSILGPILIILLGASLLAASLSA